MIPVAAVILFLSCFLRSYGPWKAERIKNSNELKLAESGLQAVQVQAIPMVQVQPTFQPQYGQPIQQQQQQQQQPYVMMMPPQQQHMQQQQQSQNSTVEGQHYEQNQQLSQPHHHQSQQQQHYQHPPQYDASIQAQYPNYTQIQPTQVA